ncbi:MAG: hypothetical protein ACRDA4_09280 [Filifactoraceae bacterium]
MKAKQLVIAWAIFLPIMGFYIMNTRTIDSITSIDIKSHENLKLVMTQKENRSADGSSKTSSNMKDIEEILSYLKKYEFRKPFRVNYETLDKLSPSYDIIIKANDEEIFKTCIAGEKFISMNDKNGTWRNYTPKNHMLFDFNFLDNFYKKLN